MPTTKDPLDQFYQDCNSLAPTMGALGGTGVGVLAAELTVNPAIGVVVGSEMTEVVKDNWHNVCALAEVLADAVAPQQAPAIDAPAPSNDNSISPSD
jgi:hypothetical protein